MIVPSQDDIAAFADYTAADAGVAPAAPAPAPIPVAPPAPKPPAPAPTLAATPIPVSTPRPPGERIFASPYARKLATEKGIDLGVSNN